MKSILLVILLVGLVHSYEDFEERTKAFCRQCIEERNGVGYYENPKDCKSYVQCDKDEAGDIKVHKRDCSDGSLFDRGIAACVPCQVAKCAGSIQPSPKCPPTTPPPTTTMIYTTLPQFDGKCAGPDGWTYLSVWGDDNIFYRSQTLGDETRIERVDCGHWKFSMDICKCVVPDRQAIALWTFEDDTNTEVDNFWTDCAGVKLAEGKYGSSARFNGTVHCEVPRFNNYPWGSALTISFWYKNDEKKKREGLLNNGNCFTEPTISLWTEGGRLGGRALVNNNGTLLTMQLGSHGGIGWNHVAFVYDGLRLKLIVNGKHSMDEIAVGAIPSTLAPLYFGRDLECEKQGDFADTSLVGFMDEVQIYDWAVSDSMVKRLMAGERNIKMTPAH